MIIVVTVSVTLTSLMAYNGRLGHDGYLLLTSLCDLQKALLNSSFFHLELVH